MKTCKNCSNNYDGSYCNICGQKYIGSRWTVSILWRQFLSQVTNIENGFLYTIRILFLNPGNIIHDYWKGVTLKYYNPFRFVLILITINLLVSYWLGINDMLQEYMDPTIGSNDISPSTMEEASQKFDNWLNLLVLLLIPLRGLFSKLLFRKHNNSYAEHLIMNAYIIGQQGFFSSITQFLFYLSPSWIVIYMPFNFIIGVIYDSWVFKSTFKEHIFTVFFKAMVIGILGLACFFVLVFVFSYIAIHLS